MDGALFEGERVYERFQRRTWRARTARAINLPADRDIVEIGRADLRENVHRPCIDEQGSSVLNSARMVEVNVCAHAALEQILARKIQRGIDRAQLLMGSANLANEVRRNVVSLTLRAWLKEPGRESASAAAISIVPIHLGCAD